MQKLSEVSHSLEEKKEPSGAVRYQLKVTKRSLNSCHTKLAVLREKRKQDVQGLERKKKELQFLLGLVEQQGKENEELKSLIQSKEEEIKQLHDSLQSLKGEILLTKQESQALRDELRETTSQLEVSSAQVQELEKTRGVLESSLDLERKRVDRLLESQMSTNMKACSAEAEVS